jgi:nitrate reductase assembly molybdenum cofactor insertion protein NarJ
MSVEPFVALAPLFRYPDDEFAKRVEEARRIVPAVETFARATSGIAHDLLQSVYSTTFDLAPSCSPYLGTHVFGDESPGRARLMVGLRMKGIGSADLPDHVAEVLENAAAFDEDEWRELRQLILVPALVKMEALLPATNPYRHLVAAALSEGGAS